MNIDDRYSTSIYADEKTYVDNADYRDFITKRIQDELSKAIMTALCTKDAIVVIKGDSTIRKDEFPSGIICRQDIYIKDLVQCKDCKQFRPSTMYKDGGVCLLANDEGYGICRVVRGDNFCSWGERKDGGENG